MEIAQLSFSEKMYWLAKYRNDLIEKIKDSEKDQKEKDQEIREITAHFNNAINKLDHMKHDKAYWSGIHGCIKAQMRKEGKYRMELQTFNSDQFGKLRITEIEGKVYYCGIDVAKALGYAKPNNAINQHCKGALKQGTPTNGGMQEIVFIPEGDVYRLTARSKLPQAEKFESWVFDEVLPQIAHTGTYEVPNKSKCPISSNAFSHEPRGSHARKSMHPCPEAVLRWEVAEWKECGGSVPRKREFFWQRG